MKLIDISSNNGKVDFVAAKNGGVTDVFLRLSMGVGCIDKATVANAKAAMAAGISVSYYHLAYADIKNGGSAISDAMAEANYFVQCVKTLGIPAPKYVAIDLETQAKLDRVHYQQWLQTWLDAVEKALGITPIIYTYASYLDSVLPAGHPFGKYPLWIANYNISDASRANGSTPLLPKGWTKFALWQYSEKGAVAGVKGNVDLSATGVLPA
jgi:GH25 family lysozyme M1 (1,4-beta-N-acetylmuramidase)